MKKILIGVIGFVVIVFLINILFFEKLDFAEFGFQSFEVKEISVNDGTSEVEVIILSKEQSKTISDIIFSGKYKKVKDKGFQYYDKLLRLQIKGIENEEEFLGEVIISDNAEQGIELNYAVKGYKSDNNGHYKVINSDGELYEKICEEIGL